MIRWHGAERSLMEKTLLEDSLPIESLGEFARRERPANRKTLSALHQYWARRPLSLSRAIIAASLLKAPTTLEERKRLHDLLKETCTLEAGYPENQFLIKKLVKI